MTIVYRIVTTPDERAACDTFLRRHNRRQQGSPHGYRAYFAASWPPDGRPLLERLVAVAKICPLHTPQAAEFYGGRAWRHVYVLQRLAAIRLDEQQLSQFVGWVLRQIGRDRKVHYVATYASTGDFGPDGRPHDGGIYRATNAVYCGRTAGGRVEGFLLDGERYSLRQGGRTLRVRDIPVQARILRAASMHRYCWAVGPPLKRAFRLRALQKRMAGFKFEPVWQPRFPGWVELVAGLWRRLRMGQWPG